MTYFEFSVCSIAVLTSSTAQLSIRGLHTSAKTHVVKVAILALAVLCMVISTLALTVALRTMRLSQVIPFSATVFVLVPLGAKWIFGETLNTRSILGIILISLGVLFCYLG